MWAVNLIDRQTSKTVVECYASGFVSYEDARQWADDSELGFRACGWTAVVTWIS